MRNYLLSNKQVAELALATNDTNRRSGRSTAIAFEILAQALRYPGKSVTIWDHFNTLESYRNMTLILQRRIKEMNLDGFVFNKSRNTITFYLTEESYEEAMSK